MESLNIGIDCSKREVKIRYIILARNYHPEKWNDECTFDQKTAREEIFINVPNMNENLR